MEADNEQIIRMDGEGQVIANGFPFSFSHLKGFNSGMELINYLLNVHSAESF